MEAILKSARIKLKEKIKNILENKSKNLCLLFVFALVLIASSFYIESIYLNSSLKSYNNNATFIIHKNSKADNKTINSNNKKNKKNKFSYVFWNDNGKKNISTSKLKASTNARLIKYNGALNLLFDSNVYTNKTKSCILSDNTAYKLFGTTHVQGLSIVYNKTKYEILDIIKSKENIIAINSGSDTQTTYSYITIKTKKSSDMVNLQDHIANKFGVSGKIVTYNFSNSILNMFILFVPFVLFIYLLYEIIIDIKESLKKDYGFQRDQYSKYNFNYKKIINVGIRFLILIIILGFVLYLFGRHINLSEDFIPTKWSDFDFWVNLYDLKTKELSNLRLFQNLLSVKEYYAGFLKTITFSVLSWILYLTSVIFFEIKYKKFNSNNSDN